MIMRTGSCCKVDSSQNACRTRKLGTFPPIEYSSVHLIYMNIIYYEILAPKLQFLDIFNYIHVMKAFYSFCSGLPCAPGVVPVLLPYHNVRPKIYHVAMRVGTSEPLREVHK